jgi:selenocysteine lyase/cysteine desulfurase
VSINVNGFDASDIGTIVDVDFDIVTRTGLQCAPLIHDHIGTSPSGTARFSIGPFNTREHVETAIRAVADIASRRN